MSSEEMDLEHKRLEIDAAKLRLDVLTLSFEQVKQNSSDYNHMSRVTADYAFNAIRTIVVINGGATLALLAFIGAFAKTDCRLEVDFSVIVNALYYFATGTGLASLTVASGYIARVVRGDRKSLAYHVLTVVGIFVGLGSVSLFFFGVNSMPKAFAKVHATPMTNDAPSVAPKR